MPPKTIAGRYEVLREIGRGGMGAVWLCRDGVLGREVAVKQLGGLPGESTPHVARALREARTAAALTHPNVVSIFDAVEYGGHVWLVMEHVESRTLSALTRDQGPLAAERVARIGAQVADGLAAAHARGTIHRDVKPGNVLVTDDDLAKISDFGIARSIGDDTLTQTGMVTGTPLYFSPQLARGADPTPADDVWALGATLYAAVEGEPPWPTRENAIAMLVHIAENPPPEPRRAGPLAPVLSRMLTSDPADRVTMAEAAEQLRRVGAGDEVAGEGTLVFAAGTPERGSDTAERPAAPPPAAPAPAPVPPVPPAEGPPAAPAPATADAGDERRSRSRLLPLLAVAAVVLLLVAGVALVAQLRSGDEDPSPAADSSRAGGSTDEGETSPAPSDSEEPPPATSDAPETTPSDEEPSTDAVPADSDAEAFVVDYYALLPSGTREAWDLLSDEMQAEVGSYGSYQGFWRTIDTVTVDGTSEESQGVVTVELTYVTDGSSESETRQIEVADTGEGLQIVGDQAV